MCVSRNMYSLGWKSTLSSENLSCPITASTPRFNVAIYNFPLPPHSQNFGGPRSSSLPQLSHGKKVKIHHAFETVVEVPEELEQEMEVDSKGAKSEVKVPRVKQIVAEIMEYLSTEEVNPGSNLPVGRLSINRSPFPISIASSLNPGPETPRPDKPPPRPPTPYPRPQPDSDNMIDYDELMGPRPKPLPPPPGPPPDYPPPPIPQSHGKSHHGAELYSNHGNLRLRMVRAAIPAPLKAPSRNHKLLKLSLEDQRWGGVVPRPAGAMKSNTQTTEGCIDETSFKYDPAGRKWCVISPILQRNGDRTAAQDLFFPAVSLEAYCEKQEPMSPGSSIPRSFQVPSNDTVHIPHPVPEPDSPIAWELPPALDPANSGIQYTISAEKKPTVREFFAHSKMSFSKLRSVASMGSLKKATVSGGEGENHGGPQRVSSNSLSSTLSSSTSSTIASQRKRKAMEAISSKGSIAYISVGIRLAEATYTALYTRQLAISTSSFSLCASTTSPTPSINSSHSQQDLREKLNKLNAMSTADSSRKGATPGNASTGTVPDVSMQPDPHRSLRQVSSEEFLRAVQIRKEMATKNIIALQEKEKQSQKQISSRGNYNEGSVGGKVGAAAGG